MQSYVKQKESAEGLPDIGMGSKKQIKESEEEAGDMLSFNHVYGERQILWYFSVEQRHKKVVIIKTFFQARPSADQLVLQN